MNEGSIYDIIRYPVVTEKTTNLAENNIYCFKVDVNASKSQIKKAIESIFNVKVNFVNVMNRKGKKKIFKGRIGQRSNFKKAMVSIEKGQKLDLSSGV